MNDLISRQDVLKILSSKNAAWDAYDKVKRLPSAQPVNYGSTKSDSSSQLKLNNDLISRRQAIDAMIELCEHYTPTKRVKHPHIDFVIEELERLPSAQPETHDKRTETHECDCISRKAAIRWVKTECNPYGKPTLDFESGKEVIEHLKQMSSAQPERKKGRWLPDNNCYYETRYMCSECKLPFHVETIMMKPSWRFCPNCGARMDGEANE